MSRFIVPVLLLVLSGFAFFGYIDSAYENSQELSAREAEFDAALERSKELIAIRDALLSKYNTLPESDLERLRKLLPNNIDNIRLILDIDNIAARYGMSVVDFSLGTTDTASGEAIGPGSSEVGTVEFSFSTTAQYEVLKQFLMDLEDSLRLVDIVSMSFASSDNDLSQYSVTIRTYWLK